MTYHSKLLFYFYSTNNIYFYEIINSKFFFLIFLSFFLCCQNQNTFPKPRTFVKVILDEKDYKNAIFFENFPYFL